MQSIGIGLLGYGGIGKIHTLCYKEFGMLYPGQLPEIELAAVCTSNPASAQRAARDGGYRAWYSNAAELIRQDDVTIVAGSFALDDIQQGFEMMLSGADGYIKGVVTP